MICTDKLHIIKEIRDYIIPLGEDELFQLERNLIVEMHLLFGSEARVNAFWLMVTTGIKYVKSIIFPLK